MAALIDLFSIVKNAKAVGITLLAIGVTAMAITNAWEIIAFSSSLLGYDVILYTIFKVGVNGLQVEPPSSNNVSSTTPQFKEYNDQYGL